MRGTVKEQNDSRHLSAKSVPLWGENRAIPGPHPADHCFHLFGSHG